MIGASQAERLTAVTERVYRHQLRPVLEEGAASMDSLFPSDDAGQTLR